MKTEIKNTKIFTVDRDCKYHWSKLPRFIKFMRENYLTFRYGAYLIDADLIGANLTDADLIGANLTGADLRGADLTGADLTGASLRGAYLRGANLIGANLTGADLRGAYLRGAYLIGANLTGADLTGADLTGASLRGADLRGANLTGANLRGAYLRDADLTGADKNIPEKLTIKDFMLVQGLGSANRTTFFYDTEEIGVVVRCGCFWGTEKAFKNAVKETHKDGQYAKEYLKMLEVVKIRFARG